MNKREVVFAVVLLAAAGLVVAGVALLFVPVAFILSGLLLAGWTWLVLSGPVAPPTLEVDE